jgi:hypothetical protein
MAVVASRPGAWLTTVGGAMTTGASWIWVVAAELLLGEAVVLDGAAEELAAAEEEVVATLATAPPADAVPAVGAAQATVNAVVASKAAAAMPWRRFT